MRRELAGQSPADAGKTRRLEGVAVPGRKGRKIFELIGRAILVIAALGVAEFGCMSLFFSSGQQWQVYVPTLAIAVLGLWLATRGVPLRRKQPEPQQRSDGANL